MNTETSVLGTTDATPVPAETQSNAAVAHQNGTVSVRKTVKVDTNQLNPYGENYDIQFDVVNTNAGGAQTQIIIGSVLAFTGAFLAFGTLPTACDNVLIADAGGPGVGAIQGFSQICLSKPVIVGQVMTSAPTGVQQNVVFTRGVIAFDFTVTTVKINTTVIDSKYDTNAVVTKSRDTYIISVTSFIQIPSVAGVANAFSIIVSIIGASGVRDFHDAGAVKP